MRPAAPGSHAVRPSEAFITRAGEIAVCAQVGAGSFRSLDSRGWKLYGLSMSTDKPVSRGGDRGGADDAVSPIAFYLDPGSGAPTYRQLVQQAERALLLGYLRRGDQLPRVKDVTSSLAINADTVLKAYRELEHKGIAEGRPGLGTFIVAGTAGSPGRESWRGCAARWAGGCGTPTRRGWTSGRWRRCSRCRCTISMRPQRGRSHEHGRGDYRAGQTLPADLGAARLLSEHPGRAGDRSRRAERGG